MFLKKGWKWSFSFQSDTLGQKTNSIDGLDFKY